MQDEWRVPRGAGHAREEKVERGKEIKRRATRGEQEKEDSARRRGVAAVGDTGLASGQPWMCETIKIRALHGLDDGERLRVCCRGLRMRHVFSSEEN